MAILEQRRTDRFIIRYDDGVPGAQTLAQDIGNFIEADFRRLRRYLPYDNDNSPDIFQKDPTRLSRGYWPKSSFLNPPTCLSASPWRRGSMTG